VSERTISLGPFRSEPDERWRSFPAKGRERAIIFAERCYGPQRRGERVSLIDVLVAGIGDQAVDFVVGQVWNGDWLRLVLMPRALVLPKLAR